MNTFEYIRKLEQVNPAMIREIGVASVHFNERLVVEDSIFANNNGGKTFMNNDIDEQPPFTDWFETGQFHQNLKFLEEQNIEFTSSGDGYEAIKVAFAEREWIAPHARTLDEDTLNRITAEFIALIKQHMIK